MPLWTRRCGPAASALVALLIGAGPAPAAALDDAEVRAIVEELAPHVEEALGQRFEVLPPVTRIDASAAGLAIDHTLDLLWPAQRLAGDEAAWVALGMFPAEQDFRAELRAVHLDWFQASYDPIEDHLYLLGDLDRAIAAPLLARELTRALIDQQEDLGERAASFASDVEHALVLQAVVDGAGLMLSMAALLQELGSAGFDPAKVQQIFSQQQSLFASLRRRHPLIQRCMLAPWSMGQNVLLRGQPERILGGIDFDDMRAVLQDLPRSSEQMLHPAAYWGGFSGDEPQAVDLEPVPLLLERGWELVASGVLGELLMAHLTGASELPPGFPATPYEWSGEASRGWGGDQWHLYRRDGIDVVVLAAVWDQEFDGGQFVRALGELGRPGEVARDGGRTVLVAGLPEGEGDRVARAVLSQLERTMGATDRAGQGGAAGEAAREAARLANKDKRARFRAWLRLP